MLRKPLAALAKAKPVEKVAVAVPPIRQLARRFVAGDSLGEALPRVKSLVDEGYLVTMDHLGEAVDTERDATAATMQYLDLMQWLAVERLTAQVDASVKPSAFGLGLADGERIAFDNAQLVCAAAHGVGTAVTLDMEDHTTTDATLDMWDRLRAEFPATGGVVQAALLRTPDDLAGLLMPGRRIRLCKGAYVEPSQIAHRKSADVDKAFVRLLRRLVESSAYPMIATHDPRLIAIAEDLLARAGRDPSTYEFQFLYGVRPADQARLLAAGTRVRLYVPYGEQWYRYFARRLIERPANIGLLVRSAVRRQQ